MASDIDRHGNVYGRVWNDSVSYAAIWHLPEPTAAYFALMLAPFALARRRKLD
jgi:hypothetical protein